MPRRFGWIAVLLVAASLTPPHVTAQDAPADRFEVATVKRDTESPVVGFLIQPGGRVLAMRYSLRMLVKVAYRYGRHQIVNRGDAWIESEPYRIEAKVPANSGVTTLRYSAIDIVDPRLRHMLQALIDERFQLKVRRETKMGDVYHLVRTNGPLRLSPVEDPKETPSFLGHRGEVNPHSIRSSSMEDVATFAADQIVQTPVVDMTNLSGLWDYPQKIRLPIPQKGDSYQTELIDYFQETLKGAGLKLEKTRGPVETLVIERAVRPSPD
jgi:uncharacterized protein (TIGR03435 family)